jgi:hypothetical protein
VRAAALVVFPLGVALLIANPAVAHEIYTGLHGKGGQLCCGDDDCAATSYRERGGAYEFRTREGEWVAIPEDRITFLPVPGDPPSDDSHHAHLCYRRAMTNEMASGNVFGPIYLWCAFIPPGGV